MNPDTEMVCPVFAPDIEPSQRRRLQGLPPIVPIVLSQAAKYYDGGLISEEVFAAQLRRLEREELEPLGLELHVRRLPNGDMRFIVSAKEAHRTD